MGLAATGRLLYNLVSAAACCRRYLDYPRRPGRRVHFRFFVSVWLCFCLAVKQLHHFFPWPTYEPRQNTIFRGIHTGNLLATKRPGLRRLRKNRQTVTHYHYADKKRVLGRGGNGSHIQDACAYFRKRTLQLEKKRNRKEKKTAKGARALICLLLKQTDKGKLGQGRCGTFVARSMARERVIYLNI